MRYLFFIIPFVTVSTFAQSTPELAPEPTEPTEEVTEKKLEEEEEISKMQEDLLVVEDLLPQQQDVPWKAIDFSTQSTALGWSSSAFVVPAGMERRVNFWKEIWGKYTSKHAVFHDSKYMDVIYSSIEFEELPDKRQLQQMIVREKARIAKVLEEIHRLQDTPEKLEGEAKVIYDKFQSIDDKDKFKESAKRKRLAWHAGCKDRFLNAIHRSGRYIRQMEDIFREHGLPIELTRLPFVESMFNTSAYSKSRASGIWQFIPSTWSYLKSTAPDVWTKHEMKGSPAIDRRNDPIPSTYAAATYLKYLFKMPFLNTWPLALTAYNQGPGTVKTLRRQLSMTSDIAEIVKNGRVRRFKRDGRNYYAQFLAVLDIESNAEKYFGPIQVAAPVFHDSLILTTPISFAGLADFFKNEKDDGIELARLYNPFLSRRVVDGRYGIPSGAELRVPKGFKDKFLASLPVLSKVSPKVVVADEGIHIVRRGENLSIIAAEWRVSVTSILEANNISRRKLIRPGQRLIIPSFGAPKKVQEVERQSTAKSKI